MGNDVVKGLFGICLLTISNCVAASPQKFQSPREPNLGLPNLFVPSDNPITPAKSRLGEELFKETRFSANGKVSCSTCHDPERVYTDGHPVAVGINKLRGARNAPTVVNAAYAANLFWDGRRESLEAQANDPFITSVEQGLNNHELILNVVRHDSRYIREFKAAFGVSKTGINMGHVTKAIATFERTLIAGDSAFDRYQYGNDHKALSVSAVRGLELFRGRAKCSNCHLIGPNTALFFDDRFHRLGVGHSRVESRLGKVATEYAENRLRSIGKALTILPEYSELGRFLVTLKPGDIERFKTPSLRNVALTAPYMHDGSIETLEAVVDMELYYRGLEANNPIILTPQERLDLVEFLRSLTSSQFENLIPVSSVSR